MKLALAKALICIAFAGAAAADCADLSIDVRQDSTTIYEPANPSDQFVDIELRLRGGARPDCREAKIVIEPESRGRLTLRAGQSIIRAQYVRDGSGLQREGDAIRLRGETLRRLLEGERVKLSLLSLEAGQFPSPLAHTQDYVVSSDDAEVAAFSLFVEVSPAIQLARSSASGVVNVDFGQLVPGKRRQADFFFRANTAVELSLTSENRGRLRHVEQGVSGFIPYTVQIDGKAIDLSSSRITLDNRVDGSVSRYSLQFEIGEFGRQWAGRYEDVLIVSLIVN